MITYFVNKDNIEDNASIQLENLSNDKNISDVVVFPDIHYASNKSIPVGVAFKSDKIYPLVSGKDTGCGVGYMTISKKDIIKQFDKDKYYKALYKNHLSISDEGLGGGNHFLSLEEDNKNLYIIVHTGTRNLGIHWYQKNLKILSEFGNEDYFTKEFLDKNYPTWFKEYDNLLKYSVKRRKEFLDGTLSFLVRNKNVKNGKYDINDSIHNYVNKENGYYVHRKGATGLNGPVIVPVSMLRGCLIVDSSYDGGNLNSCAHGAGRIMSRSKTLKHWLSMKKSQRKKYEKRFSELLVNGKFNINQIQEFDFAYKNIDNFFEEQPFIYKISETIPICTIKFSEVR